MKSSLLSRVLSVCLAFGLLFATSLPSYANEIYVPTQEDIDLFLEDYNPADPEYDYLNGLHEYFEDNLPQTYGLINDDTGTTSYGIDYYAGVGFGDWRSETNWGTGTDVATQKTFAIGNIATALRNVYLESYSQIQSLPETYFANPGIGYTIKFLRAEDDYIPKDTKVAVNLTFNDQIYNNTGTVTFSETSRPTSSSPSSYKYNQSPMLGVTYTSHSSYVYMKFNNKITVGGIDLDGNDVVIGTFDNYSEFVYDFTAPVDLQYFYVDVEYNAYKGYSGTSSSRLMVPLVYNFNTSGSIEFDESGQSIGLLKGIIEWLRNILNAITNLPSQIWSFIENGLKILFIPSADFMSGTFDSFKNLAESKLGFLYTILDMVIGLFQSLTTSLVTPAETLTIPRLALPFPYTDSGYIVLWEDMTFNIRIEGLDVLYSLAHLVTSILLITATINYCVHYLRNFFSKE